ncbi:MULTISPECIES: efflux RND transporter periplasmic adaptor subunit [Variovorax]|jgi:RND family efflux transporter MFP subunit|uniref:efflux RND transporter periplasmic adaptor subunit n=1 Tax=Variovorax TaxID=34072 RepID=UPI00086CE5EA|nr:MULTISPECIES: efflux RND transporter periplasmic adaptor subunit [Variovorax]MBN8753591.1 efflux RND transporter periplasmic adaptor subunit [Variovorax sp.]ODU12927.1 MAG: efflux transporter periplasmic adaptor subunit [Variovorax sp. SCN 67-85]ODV27459.1 MAG: efflux transporter periplasmic adaptor subunit [Variovorax sp. SCN 67-20]OJZ12151.1 MAG: efflux transporter periplasmic adaptor subunit [Variovorax sp. 67-131]UKI06015.1 efflux RND transporter periplasmic adaptor subunit [Variovorax 
MTEQRHSALAIHPIAVEEGDGELLRRRQIVRRTRWLVLIVLVLLGLGAARTVFVRIANARALEAGTTERAKQYVQTALPRTPTAGQTLSLPGTLQGFVQSPISARASGYLKRWTKDIGSRVEKGELLAEIETPEIDQQLSQAVAARAQAASGLELARSTADRWEALRKKDVVSQQELDERRSAVAQATSNVAAADANVQRLKQTEGFKRVVAPFAGVITRRNVDVGDLIDAGSGGGAGRALFLLAQTDPLRVYINVPQAYAQLVKAGQPVVVTQAELRGQTFKGQVARTAGSIDTTTRMMQVEVSLPNSDGALLPGAYVQVSLPLAASRTLSVPSNALLFRAEGTRIAVVDPQGRVNLRAVTLGRNYGENVEVIDGLEHTDRMVLNPSDSLAEGDVVAVAPETPPAKAPTPKAPA